MKAQYLIFIRLNIIILSFFSFPIFAQESPNPQLGRSNIVSLELLGRSILYGVQLERSINMKINLGAGMSKTSAGSIDSAEPDHPTVLLPLYCNYYFADYSSLPTYSERSFVSFGVTWVSSSAQVAGRESILGNLIYWNFPLFPSLGFGHEWISSSAFLLRGSVLLSVASRSSLAIGINLGYLF